MSIPRWRRALSPILVALGLLLPGHLLAAEPEVELALSGDDYVVPDSIDRAALDLQADDPLGLAPGLDYVRAHSLGPDVFDVWTCDLGTSVSTIVAELNDHVLPYFTTHSRGRYQLEFRAKGAASGGEPACYDTAAANASPDANGVLFAGPWSGGVATPGNGGTSFPDNQRWAFVGYPNSFLTVAAHELGHTLTWPHSFTKTSGSEYDNALDLMSGNYGTDGFSYGTYPFPYDTAVINRYAAGWIDTDQVLVLGSADQTLTLQPSGGSGIQMAVIPAGPSYYTLGARSTSAYDPISDIWQGVEVYQVTPCPEPNWVFCFGDPRFAMGFREHVPLGQVPFDPSDFDAYSRPLAHVIRSGASTTVAGRQVTVTAAGDGAYQVTVEGGPAGSSFTDTSGHVFEADIEWLSASGITKGCNPPANDRFCPDDPVTRAQMAAFLHRALPHLVTGPATDFVDDDGSVFEADIEWLSATGVTRGCNPPTNDMFCPSQVVTRAQMAAFLHRALPDLAQTGTATDFVDDDGSVFEADIEWLAATGVTRGCNPPVNDRFCPDAAVTRGAMAAFLHRALGG